MGVSSRVTIVAGVGGKWCCPSSCSPNAARFENGARYSRLNTVSLVHTSSCSVRRVSASNTGAMTTESNAITRM